MTSTNDGKDVKSNLSSRPKDKTYYIELYKSLEARLSGEGTLSARTSHVCDAWRRVYSLHQHSAPSTHPHLLSWLQRHTAHTVLQTEWGQSKDEQIKLGAAIDALIAEAAAAAANRDEHPWERQLLARARWFQSVLADPWGHPVLKSLLAKETVTDEQILEWLISERGLVFTTRLRQLAACKCMDLALLLAATVMERARRARDQPADDEADHSTEPDEDEASFYSVLRCDAGFVDVWDLLTDIEFVLLGKQDKRDRIIELAKQTPLRDGYQLVERLRNRLETCPRDKKLWKNAKEVATLIAQVVIARCMVLPSCTGAGRTALYCCARSLARLVPAARLPAITAALAAPAVTARHLHTLCAAIHAQLCQGEGGMKPFVCELYVRAITAGMNELERLKLNSQNEAEARSSEQTLASWFTQLGTLLGDSARLRAECALTAFSVHPAPNMYERVRRVPAPAPLPLHAQHSDPQEPKPESTSDFGSWANDSRTQSNLVKTSETLQLKHTQHQANVLSTAILTEGEALGLQPELGQDLAVLLSGPRVKTLSWDMDRELLLENCRVYMERTHGGTRALTTELKYLNLDPRAFQHLPEEDDDENDLYYGIEKGFEHLVQLEEPEEIWQNAFFDPEHTESANDSEVDEYIMSTKKKTKPPVPSSDEEDDPLSLIADAKKEKKSKEKEHRRKKTHKRDTSKDGKERRKDKPKKERKKKSDQPTTGTLTSLLGMKVTKMPSKVQDGEKKVRKKKERRRDVDPLSQVSVTDSDYDSQGKQSQASDHDPSVLFDGLFSMDELKSPERRGSSDSQKPAEVSHAVRNTTVQKTVPAAKPSIPAKVPKVRSIASGPDVSRARSPYALPTPRLMGPDVNEKVKRSITKLLQFRKNKTKASDVPKSPLTTGPRSDNLTTSVPTQSLIGMKVHNADKIPKVYMNKHQSQQIEAIKKEINDSYNETRSSEYVPKIFSEPANLDPKLMSPQNVYNAQRQQDARYQQYNNPMPNIVQNPNVFSESQKAYSPYFPSQKQSPYCGYTVQSPRSTSVIDTSYVSPQKQIDRQIPLNLTPPKSSANHVTYQTYHTSMQNLTQNNEVKFDQQKQSRIDPKCYKQYGKNNAQEISQRLANITPANATNQAQSQSSNLNCNTMQQQNVAMAKARDDFMKLYQTLPANENINGVHKTSPPKQMNSQAGPNFKADAPKQMSSSMQDILNETLAIVSYDIAKGMQSSAPRPAHSNNVKPFVINSQTELSKVQQNCARDNKLPNQQVRLIQNANQEKPINVVKDVTAKQQNVTAKETNENPDIFKEFLKELQNSINAGVIDSGKSINLNKEVKVTPVNKASTSTPAKKLELSPQCAKQLIQQKKPETAPNTFSRLSYLHKTKQSEMKKDPTSVNLELCKTILDHKMSKTKYLKNDVTISRVDKHNPVSSKANTNSLTQKGCPLLTKMLDASPKAPTCQTSTSMTNVSQNSTSDMTNREHADLLLLLRNQPTLKIPTIQTRLPLTSDVGTSTAVSNTIAKVVKQLPVTHQRTQDDYASTLTTSKDKNVDLSLVQTQENKDRTKEEKKQDWQSVMNAIRAHSTPPLGLNALDMVLKKDSRKNTSSRSQSGQKQRPSGTSSLQNKTSDTKKRDHSSRSGSSTRKTGTEKQAEAPKRNNQSEVIKKTPQSEAPKRSGPPNKQFPSNAPKVDDPFISGIPNSDYDLLGELIDDDLRRELGELSSDEESYRPQVVVSTKAKGSCDVPKNTNACSKVADVPKDKPHVIEPKTICKNEPDLKVAGLNCTRTSINTPKTGYTNVIMNHPSLPDATKLTESRPTVLCSNIESQPMPTNVVVNHTEPNHYIANIAAGNQPTNLIITTMPTQPMVLISRELVYDPYPTIQIHERQVSASLCNVTQNAYVTLNTAPNIALYTTQQFAAPVINPVIIGNAMTTTNVTTAIESQQVNPHYVNEEVSHVKETETNSLIEESVLEESNIGEKHVNSDSNANKNSERKVLSQMQENNTYDSVDNVPRIKRLSVDSSPLETKQDEERIKMKRQSLLNRTINQPCFYPPIALTYTPLSKKNNLGKLQNGTPKNGTVISSFKLRSNITAGNKGTSVNTNVESSKSEINNENIESTNQASSTKENKKIGRRILLRSSKKLENRGTPGKIKRVPLRRNKFKPKPSEVSDKDANTNNTRKKIDKIEADTNTPKRTSKRIQDKTKLQVEKAKSNTASNLEIIQVQATKVERSEDKINSDVGLIDFENELSGTKIIKTSSEQKHKANKEHKTVTDKLDTKESTNSHLANGKGPQTVENNKIVQTNNEKSPVSDEPKPTPVSNLSTQFNLDPSVLLKKLERDVGNQLVIKRPPVTTDSKKPILMTIKNQNQAILANEATSEDINAPQGNTDKKSQKKSFKKTDTNSKLEVAQKEIFVPIINKMHSSTSRIDDNNKQQFKGTVTNKPKESLPNVEHKSCEDLATKIPQINKKTDFSTPSITDESIADDNKQLLKATTINEPKDILLNSEQKKCEGMATKIPQIINKTNLGTPSKADNNKQQIKATTANESKEILPTVEQKKSEDLAIKIPQLLNKTNLSTPSMADNNKQLKATIIKEPKEIVEQKNCEDLATKKSEIMKKTNNLTTPSRADSIEPKMISNKTKEIFPTVQEKGGEEVALKYPQIINKRNSSKLSIVDNIERKLSTTMTKQIIPILQQKVGKDLATENTQVIKENLIKPQTLPLKLPSPVHKRSLLLPKVSADSTISTEASLITKDNNNRHIISGQKTNKLDPRPMNEPNSVVTLSTNKDVETNRSPLIVDATSVNKVANKALSHKTKDQGLCKKNVSQPHVPQLRKEDVIIEEVPMGANSDPTKKCVRVKLPNGKVFKATVSGRMNIDYDSLFAEPAMRAILAGGLNDGKRYTLNIKQVSKAIKTNPSKILDTKISEINIKEKKPDSIDTVNLISDDEDEDVHTFSTEFGKFTTKTDLDTLTKHQKRFSQKCVVKLYKQTIYKSNRTKPKSKCFPNISTSLLTRNKSKLVKIQQTETIMVPEVLSTPVQSIPIPVLSSPVLSTPDLSSPALSTPVPSTPVLSTPVMSTPVMSTPVMSTPVMSTPVMSTPVMSTPVMSTPVMSTPVLSSPALSTPVPSTPVASTPVPSTSVPSTPVPSTPVPSTPVPSTPVPSTPVPSTPVPSTPVPSTPVPSTPVPSIPVPSTPVPSIPVLSIPVHASPISVKDDLPELYLKQKEPTDAQNASTLLITVPVTAPKVLTTSEVIEIDDSSNDSIEFVFPIHSANLEPAKKIVELKSLLLKDLGVDVKGTEIMHNDKFTDPEKVTAVEDLKNALLEDLGVTKATEKQEKNRRATRSKPIQVENATSVKKSIKKCFIKIPKCDDLVMKYEMIKNLKRCFVMLKRCDLSPTKTINITESDGTSENEETEDTNLEYSDDFIDFDVEEAEGSPKLSRCPSVSILNNLWDDTCQSSTEYLNGRSSPVMEIFEALVYLHNKSKENTVAVKEVEKLWQNCDSEWMITKHAYSIQEKICTCLVKEADDDENEMALSVCSDTIECPIISSVVPKLITIALKRLEDNPYIVQCLQPLRKVEHMVLIDSSVNNLKRKAEQPAHNTVANKVLKLGTLAVNAINTYSEIITKIATAKSLKAESEIITVQEESGHSLQVLNPRCQFVDYHVQAKFEDEPESLAFRQKDLENTFCSSTDDDKIEPVVENHNECEKIYYDSNCVDTFGRDNLLNMELRIETDQKIRKTEDDITDASSNDSNKIVCSSQIVDNLVVQKPIECLNIGDDKLALSPIEPEQISKVVPQQIQSTLTQDCKTCDTDLSDAEITDFNEKTAIVGVELALQLSHSNTHLEIEAMERQNECKIDADKSALTKIEKCIDNMDITCNFVESNSDDQAIVDKEELNFAEHLSKSTLSPVTSCVNIDGEEANITTEVHVPSNNCATVDDSNNDQTSTCVMESNENVKYHSIEDCVTENENINSEERKDTYPVACDVIASEVNNDQYDLIATDILEYKVTSNSSTTVDSKCTTNMSETEELEESVTVNNKNTVESSLETIEIYSEQNELDKLQDGENVDVKSVVNIIDSYPDNLLKREDIDYIEKRVVESQTNITIKLHHNMNSDSAEANKDSIANSSTLDEIPITNMLEGTNTIENKPKVVKPNVSIKLYCNVNSDPVEANNDIIANSSELDKVPIRETLEDTDNIENKSEVVKMQTNFTVNLHCNMNSDPAEAKNDTVANTSTLDEIPIKAILEDTEIIENKPEVVKSQTDLLSKHHYSNNKQADEVLITEILEDTDNIENKTDAVQSQPDSTREKEKHHDYLDKLQHNINDKLAEADSENIANNSTLDEVPFEDIPHQAYEIEITDTSSEDITNNMPILLELHSLNLVTDETKISSDLESQVSEIKSPLFIDNKEIMFNYHDYSKQPTVNKVQPTISDEHSNDCMPSEHTFIEEETSKVAEIDNLDCENSSFKREAKLIVEEASSNAPTAKIDDSQNKINPDCKYELIQEDDWLTVITTETDNDTLTDIVAEGSIQKSKHVEDTEIITEIQGIEYKDPIIGTCYVFPLDESGSSASNISSESLGVSPENSDGYNSLNTLKDADFYDNVHDIEFYLIAPKNTYSKRNLKRKMNMRDLDVVERKYRKGKNNDPLKIIQKRYRKGKNIDCRRQSVNSISELSYGKEYKQLLEYCSSVKFSYTRPFHKECVEVNATAADWPKNKVLGYIPQDSADENLFVDLLQTPAYQPDPASQTLTEEISYQYTDALGENESDDEAYETNFSMGFGEGSGRVIQNLKKESNSNVSAATLSDVKQSQPFLVPEDYDDHTVLKTNKDDQMKKIRQYFTFIELRDKVRSFFKKTSVELKTEWMQKNVKECDRLSTVDFPYDLCSLDYVKPSPTETIVQVVQLGQLPVSAAAQNPVTCDPRVTQVSDASPPQCSGDNSPNDDSQSEIKTEYTELTTADLTLPRVQEYAQQNQAMNLDPHDVNNLEFTEQTISLEMEIKAEERPEIKEEVPDIKEEGSNSADNTDLHTLTNATPENIQYLYGNNTAKSDSRSTVYDSSEQNSSETFSQQRQLNGASEKTDQIAHAMNAAGITTTPESITTSRAHALVNILSQKIRQSSVNTTQTTTNTYSKTTSINAMALQQALAQILPPPLNQTSSSENNQTPSTPVGPQVLHIVQGKNASGNQITLVDNTQQSVISTPNATQVLHIVQNKGATTGQASNGTLSQQSNSFSGLSLVDAGLQQGGNQLLHIVNTGNQKNATPGQLLKRVNLLTNLTNVQGSNEQKMVQFVCKSADGKAIQLNAPHQRSMVLRLQPIETSNVQAPPAKPAENQELSPSPTNSASSKESVSQQEIKSRSIYEENYAKFIQNSSSKTPNSEKATSLPKFNQAFGKAVFQDGNQKQGEVPNSNSHLTSVNTNSENNDGSATDKAINLEHIGQIRSPPLLLRKQPAVTSQSQSNLVQQIKQTIAPMNIQTMHGGVIYTRQIPVNIGGGQTINLITVPSTELINEDNPKSQTANQSEVEPSIIKIVPQNQNTTSTESSQEENNSHMNASNENAQNPQPQPVLTQMRIKLPMLSKAPQMVPGARVVRPSFFQIQRNVIGGANQPVYQQLVLTAAPPLGQQTIRLPQAQATRTIKVPSENQSSSESQMSSSTLEQLREFDMVLEQVKERSTVQPGTNANNSNFNKIHNTSSDTTDGTGSNSCSNESTQVLYSIGNNQSLNVAYVNRKTTVTTPTTSTYVRSPDSSGIADSPTSSTHVQIPHTVTTDSSPTEMSSQSKPAKVGSKSKSRPKSTSNPPNTLKLNTVPPKTSSQKPLEDEQTTQRILYILAEYKEQVENSPDKDKPAPRRRSNPPSNPGSSKRKKSSSSRRSGTRDMSPVHGEDTCRTMGSEDSSCGTSQGDCTESCLDSHSPQDSPRKVARKITFDQDPPAQTRPQPQRNVIVADGQTITVARGATGKPATAVLMPANYILPVSMMKGGQQIAIVTNRGPKLLTVGGEAGAANALLLQRLIGPGGLKPVLARPGVRHVRLPTAALHNLQAFNLATATSVQPPDSTASPTPGPTPPELADTRATSSPWADRDEVKPERGSSPEGSEPWNLPSAEHEYTYEETVRTDNMDRTVLDPIPDRYSPDMEAQRIFDKMFDVDSKKSYSVDSPRCAYDIDASDCDDKAYQVVQKKDGTQRQHRLSHVSAAALRHKYAILEHELRLQKSLSEECEDLGVDSPSASELFPEAELLFAASPAHEHNQEAHHSHTPQPIQSTIPQPDLDDQIATDHLIPREIDVSELGDVGIVAVSGDGMQATIALDQEEFARSHPNTTFHSEPTEEVSSVQPFTIAGLKGRHITSTIFHSNSAPATVLMAAPQATVISQAPDHGVKYEIENMINSMPSSHNNEVNLSSVLVKDDGLTRFDNILTDSRELHLTNTASAIVHSSGNATQVIRRVCYEDDKRERDARFLIDEPDNLIAGDDAKMIAEDSSRDATMESMADVDDDRSSPERHAELFWESNSASERSESRRPLDFSSDSDKCCKSPSFDETNSTDSSGVGTHMRLDSVIKEARGRERSGSADGSSADDTHPPLRTYPPKRLYHPLEEAERSLSGKTRAGERSPDSLEVRRRASGRGVVKRGCHCCNGSPVPPRPKKPRQRKPTLDFNTNN